MNRITTKWPTNELSGKWWFFFIPKRTVNFHYWGHEEISQLANILFKIMCVLWLIDWLRASSQKVHLLLFDWFIDWLKHLGASFVLDQSSRQACVSYSESSLVTVKKYGSLAFPLNKSLHCVHIIGNESPISEKAFFTQLFRKSKCGQIFSISYMFRLPVAKGARRYSRLLVNQ